MSGELIALVLDIIILCFLGATIFYVMRLSKNLNTFKAHRREFDNVITSLLSSIDQAERAVQTLKQASAQEAGDLENLIRQSKAMSEELKIINEAGEGMAQRLEKLAEQNRVAAQMLHPSGQSFTKNVSRVPTHKRQEDPVRDGRKQDYTSTLKNVAKSEEDVAMPSFMIQDRDIADLDTLESHLDSSASNDAYDDENDVAPKDLQSQAERELFDALRASKRNISQRGRS
ncbi:MAG: hypothetical protein COB36_04505 [Alphaproteobacteria bacterium]|nr:MAG: hypothetical protein COB36_04505 [Alphaproteobacteria bacterium]